MNPRWIGLALGCFLAGGPVEARGEGGIVAIVNNQVITASELEGFVGAQEAAAKQKLSGPEFDAEVRQIRADGLEALVNRQLVKEEFARLHMTDLHSRSVESQIDVLIREEFHGDGAAFMKWIAERRRMASVKTYDR
jgi:hypothetical protein